MGTARVLPWVLSIFVLVSGEGCHTVPTTVAGSPSREELAAAWNDWGTRNLQNADVIFMRGECYLMMGTLNFSDLSTDLTASRFSHIGLVAVEEGDVVVYDIRTQGCFRTRFGELLADRKLHQVAVKRHRCVDHASRDQIASFCRELYLQHPKYDDDLKLDNQRLYCTELVEEAYRSTGYPLSEPVAIQDLPNYDRHRRGFQLVQAVSNIEPEQKLLIPGNDQIGIWANPDLQLVLDLPSTKVYPRASGPSRF